MMLNLFTRQALYKKSILLEKLNYEPTVRALIINADDVGMHQTINDAAFELYDRGSITSMSLMACTPAFEHAAEGIRKRKIAVGVHLTLTNEWQNDYPWAGVLPPNETPSLYNKENLLWATTEDVAKNSHPEEVIKELTAQIEKISEAGLNISHLDTHMIFTKENPELLNCCFMLARQYKLPIVFQKDETNIAWELEARQFINAGFFPADNYIMHYDRKLAKENPKQKKRNYYLVMRDLTAGVHHLVIHPAVMNPDPQENLFDSILRHHDYLTFCDRKIKKQLSKFKLTNYIEIKALYENINRE